MLPQSRIYTPPSIRMLRWLTESSRSSSPSIQLHLLSGLFTSRKVVCIGGLNGLMLNGVALAITHQITFLILLGIDAALGLARMLAVQRVDAARASRGKTPTDAYIIAGMLWVAFQGAISFACWRSGNHTLQLLCTTTILGMLGPLALHHAVAPRLALLLVSLCTVPFALGGATSGDPWLLLQVPLFVFGCMLIVTRSHAMALTILEAEEDSGRRAHHDPLTGLLNRAGLSAAVAAVGPPVDCRLGVFYIDLDSFKTINDSLGHHAGDLLLQQAARRLLSVVRPGDFIARAGGDEFIVMTRGMTAIETEAFARRLVDCVSAAAYRLDVEASGEASGEVSRAAGSEDTGRAVRIGASVGFACAPEDGDDTEELCRHADIALYRAKAAGRGVQRRFAA